MKTYNGFRGEFGFLSNFYESPITFEGLTYTNAESAYQSMKCYYPQGKIGFVNLNGKQAKKRGKLITLRPGWNSIKYDIMYDIVKCKFLQNEDLYNKLIETNDIELVEYNTWGDTEWGICDNKGNNILGKILMKIRSEFIREVNEYVKIKIIYR